MDQNWSCIHYGVMTIHHTCTVESILFIGGSMFVGSQNFLVHGEVNFIGSRFRIILIHIKQMPLFVGMKICGQGLSTKARNIGPPQPMMIPQFVPTARGQIQRMPLTNLFLFLHHWLLLGSGFLSGIPLRGGQVLLRWGWWFFVIIKRFIIVKWSFRHMSTRSAVFGWNVHLLSMFLIHNNFLVISIFFYKS